MFKQETRIQKVFGTLISTSKNEVQIKVQDYSNIVKIIRQRKDRKDFQIITKYGKLFLRYIGQKEVVYT